MGVVQQSLHLHLLPAMQATQFGLAGQTVPTVGASLAAAAFGFLVYRGFRRIKRLDKFEKEVRS